MPPPSTIQILRNDTEDITRYALFAQTRFEIVASATPGTATIVLKDPNRVLEFATGDDISLVVDGVKLWGGLLLGKSLGHFFPAVDTTDLAQVHDLQWTLHCTDYNIWMDKRVIRNPDNYLEPITVGPGKTGVVLREEAIPRYMDVPPGLDYVTYVDDTDLDWQAADVWDDVNGGWLTREGDPAPMRQQGETWRKQLDEVTNRGAYEWRIDASKRLHVTKLELLISAWGFVDRNPNGVTSIGMRDVTIREDGMQMVTDALVWGGRQVNLEDAPVEQTPVFARYPDPPPNEDTAHGEPMTYKQEETAIARITQYGRWQRAELKFGDPYYFDQDAVKLRAHAIVAGPDTGTNEVNGLDMGLNRPVWQVTLSWFAHDVPGMQHLIPGQIVPLVFYTMGESEAKPLALLLPLRRVQISFPTLPPKLPGADPETYVRFDGEFGISFSDSRYLWRVLRAKSAEPATILAAVGDSSTRTMLGALGGFFPAEAPDGNRKEFTLPFPYIAGTTTVYINGLLQRAHFEYVESNPTRGKINFAAAPFADDTIWVVCRTGME